MPCLDISLPRTTLAHKERLMERLTQIAFEQCGFEPEIFRIRFWEYDIGEAGMGGKLWDGKDHAHLHFLLYSPRLKKSVKKLLMEQWSAAFREIMGRPDWNPVIHIGEHPYDNVGARGTALYIAHPEVRGRKFYYDLPED